MPVCLFNSRILRLIASWTMESKGKKNQKTSEKYTHTHKYTLLYTTHTYTPHIRHTHTHTLTYTTHIYTTHTWHTSTHTYHTPHTHIVHIPHTQRQLGVKRIDFQKCLVLSLLIHYCYYPCLWRPQGQTPQGPQRQAFMAFTRKELKPPKPFLLHKTRSIKEKRSGLLKKEQLPSPVWGFGGKKISHHPKCRLRIQPHF